MIAGGRGKALLHYVFDPLCGWCYGAAPLVAAAREVVDVRLHAGGMLAGPNRRPVSAQFRNYVAHHDRRITELSGQPFGAAYTDGLLRDTSAMLDSEPPIAAILAAERVAGRGLDMLARLQVAHYVEGRRIAERPTLIELAVDLGLDGAAFDATLRQVERDATRRHIEASRKLLTQLGGGGFPTLALEQDGRFVMIDISEHFGRPQQWQAWLRTQVQPSSLRPDTSAVEERRQV